MLIVNAPYFGVLHDEEQVSHVGQEDQAMADQCPENFP